jgi:hypothetical protein
VASVQRAWSERRWDQRSRYGISRIIYRRGTLPAQPQVRPARKFPMQTIGQGLAGGCRRHASTQTRRRRPGQWDFWPAKETRASGPTRAFAKVRQIGCSNDASGSGAQPAAPYLIRRTAGSDRHGKRVPVRGATIGMKRAIRERFAPIVDSPVRRFGACTSSMSWCASAALFNTAHSTTEP